MRVPILLVLFSIALSTLATAAVEDKEYIEDVKAKLAAERKQLEAQGYRESSKPQIVALERGKTKSIPLELKASTTYAIIAACDKDCTHVTLSLRDDKRQVLVQSPEKHHTVIISGKPQHSGRYLALLGIPGCTEKEDACYVGLLLLEQVAASAGAGVATTVSTNPAATGAPGQEFIPYDNFDLTGSDLTDIKDLDMARCGAACLTSKGCIGYSFDKWNRRCFLKGKIEFFRLEPNTISGLRPGVPKPETASTPVTVQRYRDKAFPYGHQESERAESFDICEKRCVVDTNCIAFTFFKTNHQCRLMATTGEYFKDNKADSGIKRQEP